MTRYISRRSRLGGELFVHNFGDREFVVPGKFSSDLPVEAPVVWQHSEDYEHVAMLVEGVDGLNLIRTYASDGHMGEGPEVCEHFTVEWHRTDMVAGLVGALIRWAEQRGGL